MTGPAGYAFSNIVHAPASFTVCLFSFLERKETKVRLTSSTTRDRAVRRGGGRRKKKKFTNGHMKRERT